MTILIIYRVGNRGNFLGVGGAWDLYDEKTSDAEIVASGVFVGFFIYTTIVLIGMILRSKEYEKSTVVS